MKFYQQTINEVLRELKTSREGLSQAEADKRLKTDGYNQIAVRGESLWRKIIAPFWNVMIGVLVAAGALSLWHHEYIDALIIGIIIMASAVIDWVQQFSTERILRSLRNREAESVEILRNGEVAAVNAEKLARGDVIILHEGQKVSADARVMEADNLYANESMLTGESMSVRKGAKEICGDRPVYEQLNMLFSGSFVVAGGGVAVVVATGNDTQFGQIAQLASNRNLTSPIQQKINKLIKWVVVAVFALAALAFLLELFRGVEPVEALRFILAFAVSAVPESLPIAITVVLALGMRRMAAKKALVRNMRAIENVGLVTTIATDKTGTLTRNELSVRETWSPRFNEAAFALQASFALNDSKGEIEDPLDVALAAYLGKRKITTNHALKSSAEFVKNLPFDYQFSLSGNVWQFAGQYEIYLKGAPEKILARCDLVPAEKAKVERKLHEFATNGFRVIAFAKFINKSASTRVSKDDFSPSNLPKSGAEFLGLAAIADELRPRVAMAVKAAQTAGVSVRMITGDHHETALAVAREVNIANDSSQVYDSRELMKLPAKKLSQIVRSTRVFARVIPEAKHKILTELNKTDVTAMTGDGVNDVSALAQANVGIAMGAGAAIAKDAGDIVLLDNNFKSIVTAIREGRIIIANVRRMLVYLLATNAGEALVTIGALLIGLPLPVVAVQILWINLATDTFMVIPLGLEPGDARIMKRPPADPQAPILNNFLLSRVIITSVSIGVITLGAFAIFLQIHGLDEARSAAFLVLIVIQWTNALVMRSEVSLYKLFKVRNRAFFMALAGTIAVQIIVMVTPVLRDALHLTTIHFDSLWACLIGIVLMVAVLELHKLIGRKLYRKRTMKQKVA